MYISRISLRNVRSFGTLDLDLKEELASNSVIPRLRTILIGENGTGKTTLLRAIAVGLCDEQDSSGLLAEPTGQFVAEGAQEAEIKIELTPSNPQRSPTTLTTTIESKKGQDVLVKKDPEAFSTSYLVCGYGISRANEGPDSARVYRVIDSVYTLFHYEETLIQTELSLRRLHDFLGDERKYKAVLNKIKQALGLDKEDSITLKKGGGVEVSGPRIGKSVPLEGWADGYRKTLAWILDVYAWAIRADCITKTGDVEGIVLVDELEQHLHPSMQTELPRRISKLLPRAQIIATTHSPLVALGAEPDELVVLKRDGENVVAHESVRDFHGYSVEDMLTDRELFDTPALRPELAEKLNRYRTLASKPPDKRSSKEAKELKDLGARLAAQQMPEVRENPALNELLTILKKHNL